MALDDVETEAVDGAMFSSDVGLLDVTETADGVNVLDSFTETLGTV
jgi:spore germination protein GerM